MTHTLYHKEKKRERERENAVPNTEACTLTYSPPPSLESDGGPTIRISTRGARDRRQAESLIANVSLSLSFFFRFPPDKIARERQRGRGRRPGDRGVR